MRHIIQKTSFLACYNVVPLSKTYLQLCFTPTSCLCLAVKAPSPLKGSDSIGNIMHFNIMDLFCWHFCIVQIMTFQGQVQPPLQFTTAMNRGAFSLSLVLFALSCHMMTHERAQPTMRKQTLSCDLFLLKSSCPGLDFFPVQITLHMTICDRFSMMGYTYERSTSFVHTSNVALGFR